MKLEDKGNPEFSGLILWDRNTRDKILHLLSKIYWHKSAFWVWLHEIFNTEPVLEVAVVRKASTLDTVSTICCATPSPKCTSGKGFSAAWQFLLEMNFITKTSVLDIALECPTSHPAPGMTAWPVCQPGGALFVGNNGWDSFPSQYLGQAPSPELSPGKSWTAQGLCDSHLQLATGPVGKQDLLWVTWWKPW